MAEFRLLANSILCYRRKVFVLLLVVCNYPDLVDMLESSTQALIVWVVDSNSVIG